MVCLSLLRCICHVYTHITNSERFMCGSRLDRWIIVVSLCFYRRTASPTQYEVKYPPVGAHGPAGLQLL